MKNSVKVVGLTVTALLLLFSAQIITISLASDPMMNANPGDVFMVATVAGQARTKVNGETIVTSASLELVVEVREVVGSLVFFKVKSGYIEVNETTYKIKKEWDRGVYNKITRTANYEGYGEKDDGQKVYFILHSKDRRRTHEGTLMDVTGGFRDTDKLYWRLSLLTYRYKYGV